MTIAIVDDDYQILARLTGILDQYYGARNYELQEYSDGLEFIQSLSEGLPDIVFMDIEMNVIDGREAVKKLRERDAAENTYVVYVSSHTEQLAAFFSLHPFDFLVKPFEDAAVRAILNRIRERMESSKKTCKLIIDRKEVNVAINDIMWVQSLGHRLEVKTRSGEEPLYCYGKLNELYEKLEATCDDFLRIHASFLVNRRFITKYTQREVYIKDQAFAISTKFRSDVIIKLHERL
ncbi:MAG: response regulator transcription factor [Lachnospiraceae bacterium]|nr:response regulator transcription factor [Lachnospiraceae bacterium]